MLNTYTKRPNNLIPWLFATLTAITSLPRVVLPQSSERSIFDLGRREKTTLPAERVPERTSAQNVNSRFELKHVQRFSITIVTEELAGRQASLSDDGTVVGTKQVGQYFSAFTWRTGQFEQLQTAPETTSSFAKGIATTTTHIVGTQQIGSAYHPTIWFDRKPLFFDQLQGMPRLDRPATANAKGFIVFADGVAVMEKGKVVAQSQFTNHRSITKRDRLGVLTGNHYQDENDTLPSISDDGRIAASSSTNDGRMLPLVIDVERTGRNLSFRYTELPSLGGLQASTFAIDRSGRYIVGWTYVNAAIPPITRAALWHLKSGKWEGVVIGPPSEKAEVKFKATAVNSSGVAGIVSEPADAGYLCQGTSVQSIGDRVDGGFKRVIRICSIDERGNVLIVGDRVGKGKEGLYLLNPAMGNESQSGTTKPAVSRE